MPPDPASRVLVLLLLIPAFGSAVLALWGTGRDAMGRWVATFVAGITLALSLVSIAATEPPPADLRAWMPSFGVAWILESDWLSSVLVLWVSLAGFVALASSRSEARTASLVLWVQATTNGLFLARDVFLAFACLGGLAVAVARLSAATRTVLVYQLAALTLLYGWFAQFYRKVYAQTGFLSTELERWRTLVLYPNEERELFLWAAVGVAILLPSFVIALEQAPRAGRLALLASFGGIVSYLLLRIVVPLSPRGATSTAEWLLAFALVMLGLAALARRWSRIAVGYHGLVLLGLFGFVESTVIGAVLLMFVASVAFYGLMLSGQRAAQWFFVIFLGVMPIPCVLVPTWQAAPGWALVATGLFAALVVRMVTVMRVRSHDPESRRRTLFAVPAMLWSLSLILGWGYWRAHARPVADAFLNPPVSREEQP